MFKNKILFKLVKLYNRNFNYLNLGDVQEYGIVIELKNTLMVAMFNKKVIYLEAIDNIEDRITSIMVPKNDYNKGERESITNTVMSYIGIEKGDMFVVDIKNKELKYISETPYIVNSVRPMTLQENVFPVTPMVTASNFYVNIETKVRRKIKQK